MNQEQFLSHIKEFYAKNLDISRRKNSDYANSDAFANFRQIEHLTSGRVTAVDGIITRMSDKMQRIANLAGGRKAAVQSESVRDTLADLANYCAILNAYLDERDAVQEISMKEATTARNQVDSRTLSGKSIL